MSEETGLMSVKEAGEIRERYGYRAIIVVGVRNDGIVDVMSHARTKADCKIIGDYAQLQFARFLPKAPFQTYFGWGNGGAPKRVALENLAQLSERSRQYIADNTHPDAEEG